LARYDPWLWDRGELTAGLAEVVGAWPLGASLAAAAAVRGLRAGRRRTALNEALHELRRPLQALALAAPAAGPSARPYQGAVQMAGAALERLEREVNGDSTAAMRMPLPARPLLESAVGRWRARAALTGSSLNRRWSAGEATVAGDHGEVARALDNLIVNAIEHGGPEIVVEASTRPGRLRVAVVDSGRQRRPGRRPRGLAELLAHLSGRRRRGHGLRVVRRIAAGHGGDFFLRSSARGTEAILELPLLAASGG
jgi:signal transduction histidine kinase